MKRAAVIQAEYGQIKTIESLTSVFEAIASMHIAQVKDKVVSSTAFFNELWAVYTQLRPTSEEFHPVRPRTKRTAIITITSEGGGLIGDIDERIIAAAREQASDNTDVYAIGSHGASLLRAAGIKPVNVFNVNETDQDVDVTNIAKIVSGYPAATVYYQTYESLMKQNVAHIELFAAVSALGKAQGAVGDDVISSARYTFEPSIKEVVAYLQSVMIEIALGQVVLESKLAQYASRFNAMYKAKSRAQELRREVRMELGRARRYEGDARLREIFGVIKKGQR